MIEPSGAWTSVSVSPTAYADAHILAIQTDGTLWAWGKNNRGQLGNFTTTDSLVPVQVPTLSDVVEVATGKEFSIARLASGATRTYDQTSHGDLLLPLMTYLQEFYYLGAYVDWSLANEADGVITESNEADNVLLTSNAVIQLGLPDLISGPAPIIVLSTPHEYVVNEAISVFVNLTNGGEGTLVAGSSFDVVVYAAETNDPLLIGGLSTYELGTVPVTIAADVPAGAPIPLAPLALTLPYGVPVGSYYIGLVIDSDDTVEEQGALPTVLVPDQTRGDGEANNLAFSLSASFVVDGITLQEALEDTVGPLNTFTTDGDATWFGRSDAGDTSTADDDQTFTDADGAQSPQLLEGESASFSLVIDTTSVVTFEWVLMAKAISINSHCS